MNTLLLLSALLGPPVGNPTSTPSVSQWCPGGMCIGNLTLLATGALKWSGRAKCSSGADGKVTCGNAAGTTALTLDTTGGGAYVSSSRVGSDAAPGVSVIQSQSVHGVPGDTNVNGANVVIAPTEGIRSLDAITKAGTGGKALTFTVYRNGVADAPVVVTEGVSWQCVSAASDQECACNLYNYLTGAGAITGMYVARKDGTCSDERLYFSPVPGVSEFVNVGTSDNANLQLGYGVDGRVLVAGNGTNSVPGLASVQHNSSGLGWSTNTLYLLAAGGTRVTVQAGTTTIANTLVQNGSLTKGAAISTAGKAESVTFAGGGGDATKVTTDLVDAGEIVRGYVGRVTTAGTTCTSFDVGTNLTGGALDADSIANDISPALNTTFTMSTAAAGSLNQVGLCTAAAGCEVTVTANGGNCVGLVVAITAFKDQLTAPTSN